MVRGTDGEMDEEECEGKCTGRRESGRWLCRKCKRCANVMQAERGRGREGEWGDDVKDKDKGCLNKTGKQRQ